MTTTGPDGNNEAAPTDEHVRAFRIGYTFNEVSDFLSLPSSAHRLSVRDAFMAKIDHKLTHRTQFHVFPTRPDLADLVAYIGSDIVGPDYAVSAQATQQEHVWRQGSWVCETRFTIKDPSGDNLSTSVVVDQKNFTAHSYWVASYETH